METMRSWNFFWKKRLEHGDNSDWNDVGNVQEHTKWHNIKTKSDSLLGKLRHCFFVFVKKEPHILFVYIPEIAHGITAE